MKPDRSKWQDPKAYDFIGSAAVDAIAWEFLRRNGDYQRDFATVTADADDKEADAKLAQWGLHFRSKA